MKKKIILLSIFILLLNNILVFGAEKSNYHSHISQEEMESIFKLKVNDIANPWTWILDSNTFTIIEENSGNLNYWWNTPNIQMSAQNSLYSIIAMSGYIGTSGELAHEHEWLVNLGKYEDANTALKKYGFRIPSPTYVGERPLITISIGGVLLPDSLLDGIGRIWNSVWDGDVVKLPTNDDLNTLVYVAPRDYDTTNITFERWVENNWYNAIDKIKDNQILLTNANPETGEKDGKVWVKKNIIQAGNLDAPGLSAKEICQTLEELTGSYYPDVAKNIILTSGIGKANQTERIMPYDLSRMNSSDAQMFNGVVDPRSDIQQSLFSTGYDKLIYNMIKSSVLYISGIISEITVHLNGFSNFTFLDNLNFNPIELWDNFIVQLLILIMMCIFVFYVVKSAIRVFSKTGDYIAIAIKAFSTFIIISLVFNITYNSENTYKAIRNISTSIFNFSNVAFEQNENINSLYGTGDAADKENVQLWLPYFNTWTSYNTNHTLLDSAQQINKYDGSPEVQNIKLPKIGEVDQTLWSTILADEFTGVGNYSGSIYRVVDHFMAPRINNVNLDSSNLSLDVKKNENYNGNIQSSINFGCIPFQLLIFFFIILKVLIFFEFIYNIATLIFNLTLSITSKNKLIFIIKELGASMLNVAIINIIVGFIVWSSLLAEGVAAFAICLFYVFLTYNLINEIAKNNSVFTPKFFRPAKRMYFKVKDMFVKEAY